MSSFDDIRLETARLLLRPPQLEDLEPLTEMMRDEPTARFIGGMAERPLCWRKLMTMIGAWHAHGFGMFSAIEKASGQWVGRLGPWQPDGWPGPEVGWAIVRESWGKGYAGRGRNRRDRLGLREAGLDGRDSLDCPGQPPIAARGAEDSAHAIAVRANCRRRSPRRGWISGGRRARSGARIDL